MATIEVCDICGSRAGVVRRFYATDRQSDAAGSMEDVGETYDLCKDHQIIVLENTILEINYLHKIPAYATNQYIVRMIKERIK